MSTAVLEKPAEGTLATVRRGLALSPELRPGLAGTVALALVQMGGRVAGPIAVQQGIDHGIRAAGGPDLHVVTMVVALTVAALAASTAAGYLMTRRLFTVSETALGALRSRTFRHIHDLSMLHQQSERRGSMVSRVTSDIDQISQFLQTGGVMLLVSGGQLIVSTLVMLIYSWQLTLVVLLAFGPAVLVIRLYQKRLAAVYRAVRERTGVLLGAVAESVVGATVIRVYGVAGRTEQKLDTSIETLRVAQQKALRTSVTSFSSGELGAGVALAAVVVVGVLLGVDGSLSVGKLTAFLFLVTLFIQPVQIATDVLNDAQNAVAGWRRVLDVLDVEPDVADPDAAGVPLPPGPLSVTFRNVSFHYPDGPTVLSEVDLDIPARTRVAVVGETGSGKTTFAKLLTRLMDPAAGSVLLSGTPLDQVRFDSLRSRVVMVPQDGFLFDATVAENIRFARPELTDDDLDLAFVELGLSDWVAGLPQGLATPVGERGEALSVGERQLVALVRAYVADPDLLVLDEATSAVDPATEVRLQRALDAVTRGRTTVAIAHRLSTAQSADEVIVVDAGRVVQRGRTPSWSATPSRSTAGSTRAGSSRRGEAPARRCAGAPVPSASVELDHKLLVADDRDLGAQRLPDHRGPQVLQHGRQVGRGRAVQVGAGRGDLEGRLLPAALAHLDDLARLEPVRRPVHLLAVHGEVTVRDQLAGLVDRAGQAGPVHGRVEAAFEQRDHGLAGLAGTPVGVVVGLAHLRFADVVLVPEALLLQQPDLVVGLLAPAAAVHAGRERPLLEVLHALLSQRDAERPRQLGLGSRVVHKASGKFWACGSCYG